MDKKWTKQQQQVIDLRNRNLLVSAAAGSGKTAVLVERIIQKITDDIRPVDIDQLLIVTFTNAAAAEMRERIGSALGKALERQPGNVRLQRQQTLLHNAQITTIHSFCLYVIRNYFHRIDLDPDFRVAEEGELKLLQSDVLDQVLERYYQEAKPQFLALSETIATGKTDQPLKEAIAKLFAFAMSYPWVEEWLSDCGKPFQVTSEEQFDSLAVTRELLAYLENLASQWARQMRQCCKICLLEDGPCDYLELLEREAAAMEHIAQSQTYQAYYERIQGFSFGRLPSLRKFAGDAAKKDQVQKLRNEVKASVKKIIEQFFFQNPAKMRQDLQNCRPVAEMLIEVTLSFIDAFSQKKREKNILDFNDLEHFALKILVEEESHAPSRTAQELRNHYEEIMIDEYQDSNYVQEAILRSVSKEAEGGHNIFMVGDVKQSIYRFRMARPELFMEKYNAYTQQESEDQRIDLHKNFRSRPEVLETVNDIFCKIMNHDIGNITYDAQAALYPGASFPQGTPGMFDTRIVVINPEDKNPELKVQELEARAVATEIRRLIKEQKVTDQMPSEKDQGSVRNLRYSDIVILLRSMTGWADIFVKSLGEMGIPARAASGTGYFSSIEVQTALNLLKILDNPSQDIPMAAVLSSPVVGLSGEELAILRIQFPQERFYQAVLHYLPQQSQAAQDPLENHLASIKLSQDSREKLESFLELLQKFRRKVSYTPIHQLLYELLEETGYQAYVYALPDGEIRKANLEMLVEKAIAYENTSYRGLFHFIRYMDQLQKYEVDFPMAEGEEAEDAVRIMSIHKSKGLEFPVVFVSGLGKMFNSQDIRERVVLHPELGIGMDVTDLKRRLKTPGLTRQLLARKIAMENTGEELRILYVALTRAKEKLILTGVLKKAEQKLAELGIAVVGEERQQPGLGEQALLQEPGAISFLKRQNASTFLQFILMACAAYPGKYPVHLLEMEDLCSAQEQHAAREELTKIELFARLKKAEPQWEEQVARRLAYRYPYEEETVMRTKVSVSELKRRAMDALPEERHVPRIDWESGNMRQEEEQQDSIEIDKAEEQKDHYIPKFMEQGQEVNTATNRGTAMHRVLECYDFTRTLASVEKQLREMEEQQKIDKKMRKMINVSALKRFLNTSLGKRMQKAAERGKLYREKPFVMGKPASEALAESKSQEMLLIQGIIDVFFEEEDGIVLMDYKTDRVKTAEELSERYRKQMELYQEAIERALGSPVKERIIYSFCLNEIVIV